MNFKQWKAQLSLALKDAPDKEKIIILLQGPPRMLDKVLRWLATEQNRTDDGSQIFVLAFRTAKEEERAISRPAKRRKLLVDTMLRSQVDISHAMTGGTLDQCWTLECSPVLNEKQVARVTYHSEVRAEVQDYLSTTKMGKEVREKYGVRESRVVEWRKREIEITCASVFSSTGWIRRKMDLEELLDVYDVGSNDRSIMSNAVLEAGIKDFPREFTQQIPVRVLTRCLAELVVSDEAPCGHQLGMLERTHDGTVDDKYRIVQLENTVMQDQQDRKRLETPQLGVSDAAKLLAKNDDAGANVTNWNRRVVEGLPRGDLKYNPQVHDRALDALRQFQLFYFWSYKRGVAGSFNRFMSGKYGAGWLQQLPNRKGGARSRTAFSRELQRDYEVGIDAVERAINGSFWEWDAGSTVMFWRWPEELQAELRDGVRVWYRERDLPSYWGRQRWPTDSREKEQLQEKLLKVVNKGYIGKGHVKSLTGFFAVPKGTDDIRIVYDASKSGLNMAIWSPNFFLPTMTSVLNQADDRTYFGDIDLGEMFLILFFRPKFKK